MHKKKKLLIISTKNLTLSELTIWIHNQLYKKIKKWISIESIKNKEKIFFYKNRIKHNMFFCFFLFFFYNSYSTIIKKIKTKN